jgi:flagellar basal-body rod protein FlgG
MQEILGVALQSMHQDMARLERIGMNLTNALTPGYKRDIAIARPFASYVGADASASAGLDAATAVDDRPLFETVLDLHAGTLKQTGQSFDLALAGDGFFEVSTDNGPAYTRQGNFHVDARGRLVTSQGYPVMGKDGEIVLSSTQPVIDASGNVIDPDRQAQGDQGPAARLKIVKFDDPKVLQRLGDGLVQGSTGMSEMKDGEVQVRQGYLENSNVSSLQEMVQMMQAMRHFESIQKIVQSYDEVVGTAIHKLGEA